MAEPLRLSGRWYWFRCPSCGWRGQRYRNVRKCPQCRAALERQGRASVDATVSVEVVPLPAED